MCSVGGSEMGLSPVRVYKHMKTDGTFHRWLHKDNTHNVVYQCKWRAGKSNNINSQIICKQNPLVEGNMG